MRNGPVTHRLLQRLCYDVWLRGPSPSDLRLLVGTDVATVVPRLVQSREAMAVWFEEQLQYFLLLDQFRPAAEVVDKIPGRLFKGELDARAAIGEILLSTGFSLRNPGNDTFVTVVLEQCLGYRVQDPKIKPVLEAGKKIYDGKKGRFLGQEGQSQSDLLQIVLGHDDFARHLLGHEHQRLLGAPLPKDAPEIALVRKDWSRFFPTLGEWLQSDAYEQSLAQRRLKTERQFLRGLYHDLLERTPDQQELRNLRNAMQAMADPAPLRSVLAKVILDSKQAKLPECAPGGEAAFISDCFLRYLAREPTATEAAAFVKAMTQDGAQPMHIVRTLVGSLEYQTY
jgi:hypothetical protein